MISSPFALESSLRGTTGPPTATGVANGPWRIGIFLPKFLCLSFQLRKSQTHTSGVHSASPWGLAGEGRTDETVWIIKTHWPERKGVAPFAVAKAVVLVRNPFDCLDSYFNMVQCWGHSLCHQAVAQGEAEVWESLLKRRCC